MGIKHCTDVDGSMIQQHLFGFDLCFLSDNGTKTDRKEQGERSSFTSLQSPSSLTAPSLFIYAEVQETKSVVSFLTATAVPSPLRFNHLEAHAERDAT